MIVENPDAFKSWLTSKLEPLCEAEPAALAKYVYALVKKDKPLQDLRESMVDQLDVFLQHETKPFVEMMFKTLKTQEYLKNAVERAPSPVQPLPEPQQPEPAAEPDPEPQDELEEPAIPEEEPMAAQPAAVARSPPPAAAPLPKHRLVMRQAPAARVGASAPRPHPHLEQTLVKVVPLNELLQEPLDMPRRRDRRDGPHEGRRHRSRSWERRMGAGRGSHGRRHGRDSERRHERSVSPRSRLRNRSPPALSPARSRSRSPVPLRDHHDRDRDRLRMPREMERDRMSRDRDHRIRLSRSRDRDRSRDRSRERSRGSLSPRSNDRMDHGDTYKRRCRDFDEKGYCMRGDLCEWDHGTDPVVLEDASLTRALIPSQPPVPEYNPLTPDIWCNGFPPYGPPLMPPHPAHAPHPPPPSRELIPIPRVRPEGAPPMAPMAAMPPMMAHIPRPPAPRKHFDYNRLGPARPPMPSFAANCSLEVKKVPRGLNDITHLNNHFSKFGKIVNIQVCYEGDPEAALITFSSPMEANIAHKSTEAVLNNRFIKVFWHNPENKQETAAPPAQQPVKHSNGTNNQHFMSVNKVLINRENMKATADNKQQAEKEKEKEKEKVQQQANDQSNGQGNENSPPEEANSQEPPNANAQQPPAPEPTKKVQVLEMHKRAQALLETQLQQQRLLIEKLEAGSKEDSDPATKLTPAQRVALLDAINSAQEGIEKLRKELVAYNNTIRLMQAAKKPKTKEEAQKEILDAELDMFNKQQEGQDVTELVKKIAELRRQMALQFPSHPAPRRPHNNYHAARGRYNTATRYTRGGLAAKPPGSTAIDHRPKTLLISGFESDELEPLVAHFSQFGEVTGKEVNLAVPELVLQFRARVQAEQAMLRGKNYNDRTLTITWAANTTKPPVATVTSNNGESSGLQKEPETPSAMSEDSLLRFDEEEEEDSEDRSWRR